ncbi:hypothetical protein ON010_g12426 [Phytophthora cinnamomi]|nr:hypothetical protein ON010_g12426 [Phytophthora cinnamomi]
MAVWGRLRAAGGDPEPLHDVPGHGHRREEAVPAHLGAGPAHRPGSGEHRTSLATGPVLMLLLPRSAAQFEQNLANVQDARSGLVNWDHENVERFLRTFRNLRNALSPLYEVRGIREHGLVLAEGGWLTLGWLQLLVDLLPADIVATRKRDAVLSAFAGGPAASSAQECHAFRDTCASLS